MRALLQRVSRAAVQTDEEIIGEIGPGLLVFLGIQHEDTEEQARILAGKIPALRIFEDASGKMNLSLRDTGGEILIVSQFTLFADCRKGLRPFYGQAARPQQAEKLYRFFVGLFKEQGITVATGRFQATMEVDLVNSGPVTIFLDTDIL